MRRLTRGSVLLVVAAGIWAFPLHASADTSSGCVNTAPEACKTVGLDGSGKLTAPTTSGTITFYGGTGGAGLAASTTYNAVDAIEFLPANLKSFAQGSYTITWGTCTDGSATGATYTVGTGGSYSMTPPSTTPSPTGVTIKTGTDGGFSCAYTLAYPSGDTPPAGANGKVKNDFWVLTGTTVVTQTASASVPGGGAPPVPEVPLAVLIPVGMLLIGGGYVFLRRRQAPVTAS